MRVLFSVLAVLTLFTCGSPETCGAGAAVLVEAGTYLVEGDAKEGPHHVRLSADGKQVVETFTRGGQQFEITYEVTARESHVLF